MNRSVRITLLVLAPLIAAAVTFFVPSAAAEESAGDGKRYDPIDMYERQEIRGWEVRVNKQLLAETDTADRVLDLLEHRLADVVRFVPGAVVEKLQTVTIWMELENPVQARIHYHPSRSWLEGNGFLPDKARAVEIGSARAFLGSARDQPSVVLHELAHAYHHQFLDDGYQNAALSEAHERAVESADYDEVLHISGRYTRHYGLTTPMEYFAEGVEAYFGTNDFYPFVRAELKEHDPPLYELIERKWQVE